MITAEVLRQSQRAGDGMIEHAADGRTIDRTCLHGAADVRRIRIQAAIGS